MQVTFRDLGAAANKLQQNGQNAAATFVKNTAASAQRWLDNTTQAGDNYNQGVQRAAQNGTFVKGVQKSGAGRFASQVQAVGQTRFSDGMSKAGPRWQQNFGPLAAAVAGVDIGPRGLRGSAQNKQRAANMSDAWMAAKKAALG